MQELEETPYPPDLYLATHRGTPGDIEFYQRVCAGAASVLELGCGGGRVLAALAATGIEAVGVELNDAFVERARDACAGLQADVVQGDMRDFSLGRAFERVVVPYNGIYCLLSERDALKCLAAAARHLSPSGLLVFDGYAADGFHEDGVNEDQDREQVATALLDGVAYQVLERSVWHPQTQRVDAFYAYATSEKPAREEHKISHRYLLSHQVAPLLAAADLGLVVLHGDFDQSAFTTDSPRLIATAAHRATSR